MGSASHVIDRVRTYFASGMWSERPGELRRGRAALHRASRIAYSTLRGFREHQLTSRAAALTYYTVLSVVPFLVFAFALLKGFGAYRTLVDGTVRPWLAATFGANPPLHDAFERVLGFVDATDVSKLGALGLLLLVYTSVSLVSSVEGALNQIWGAKAARPFLRQVTDYVTLLVTTPLLVLAATTFSAAAQTSSFLAFLRETLRLAPLIDLALRLTPVLVVGIALFAIYIILPNVRTRPASAAAGAAVAAVLWQGALVLHVRSQLGVAGYNALYSVLGAIPIFLVWLYVSWVVVLAGAELAANHQNELRVRQSFHARRADQALKETIAVACAARIAADFLAGQAPRTAPELAGLLEVPPPVVEEALDALVRAGLLARAVAGREIGYLPARDPAAIHASDLRDAIRRDPSGDDIRAGVERRLVPELSRVLAGLEDDVRRSVHNLTLRELGLAAGARSGADARAAADGADAVDPKQPDVPR